MVSESSDCAASEPERELRRIEALEAEPDVSGRKLPGVPQTD